VVRDGLDSCNPVADASCPATQFLLRRDAQQRYAGSDFGKVGGSMTKIQKSPSSAIDAKMSWREFVSRASAAGVFS
jgi:hypothetical protein